MDEKQVAGSSGDRNSEEGGVSLREGRVREGWVFTLGWVLLLEVLQ